MQKFKLNQTIGFINTDGLSNAKRQVKLSSNDENIILVDNYEGPIDVAGKETKTSSEEK